MAEVEDEFRLRFGRTRDHQGSRVAHAAVTAGRLARRGRGQKAVAGLRASTRQARGLRRVIVKARISRLKAGSAAARAHLAYLQRDGVGPDGERGRLYSALEDEADGRAFLTRCDGDRHQFRFIVSPEDGGDLGLRAYTRRLMGAVERDLNTLLDWVAVDHTDTAHPHTHVIVRGKTQRGADLLISQDYITEGMRLRAREIATELLGPQSEAELQRKLTAEIAQPRFTRIDRAILREAADGVIDIRAGGRSAFEQGLRSERLRRLEGWDLASPISPGVWRISADLESALRRWGERSDILKTMRRALAREGQIRDPASFVTFDEDWSPVIGKVIDKGLAGPTEERAALIVDGVDGKVRRLECSLLASADVPLGALIQTGHGATVADHTIAEIAEGSGVYRTEEHLRRLRARELPLPEGADAADVVRSHVRRLEALRRARIVERYDAGRWAIPRGFLEKAAAHEQRRGYVRVVSLLDLEAQVASSGATWLDRQLVAREPVALADRGFGAEAAAALRRRSQVLVSRGLAHEGEAGVRYQRGLIGALAQIEARQAGEAYARAAGGWYEPAEPGRTVEGTYREKLRLDSGMFAVVETRGLGFALVPWRPVIENQLGRYVRARLEVGGGVEWQLGRSREIDLPGF